MLGKLGVVAAVVILPAAFGPFAALAAGAGTHSDFLRVLPFLTLLVPVFLAATLLYKVAR